MVAVTDPSSPTANRIRSAAWFTGWLLLQKKPPHAEAELVVSEEASNPAAARPLTSPRDAEGRNDGMRDMAVAEQAPIHWIWLNSARERALLTGPAMRLALFVSVCAFGMGCTNGGVLAERLRTCGLLSEGETGLRSLGSIYAPDACYRDCLAEAPCEALEQALCRSELELLVACDQRCAFRCADGSLLAVERRCDGFAQCADGGDEAGCPGWGEIACDSGSPVMGARCDWVYQCPDGSDERDCGHYPTCDGGRTYSVWDRCNGYRSCTDGADEAGCPQLVCDDGTTFAIPEGATPRCDGWSQCPDGTDERDCASLTLNCSP
jgi:hypothetical protein